MEIVPLDIRLQETAEEVWSLQHPAYRTEAALIGVADLPPLQDTIQSLQSCGESFLGCRNGEGELVGAVSYESEGAGRFGICRMMVHPDCMRQGIGSRLLDVLLASEPGATVWEVTAEVRNFPALRLYEKYGFQPVETIRPIPGIEMIRLERRRNGETGRSPSPT
ncbi:GNAT family N-acetyltransferase [Cohnella hongkongensis]|uniref:GNAT family N-acetyltransferase n=1 Tax=Cohnella hongkongensis TaxID=178337 RepID=A0ABV9FJQ2_9BACL